ncbi:SAM-dependent methyltransferase [Saccharothrix luteola]|uniref:SAM-dependent methyltransferase n=1 Tax=Saccharothrix luteola TaxID=2893018 RepID=UPI001E2C84EC|nr:SAM-dependent methyltransferase [Saccharothrix luteola]MCC8246816.1 SAM-dependent methyltransferase [Saccharothrix luteola]
MERPSWVGPDIDLSRPSPARVYDVHLGGAHNFQVDREAAQRIVEVMPGLPRILRANRAFLRRAVRYLVGQGVTQFLDLGSGIPTAGNVHEVAWSADPGCRIVYVDVDPVAVAHSRAILGEHDNATAVHADLRRPREVLAHPETVRTLDFTRPVGVLMFAVLHFVPDSDKPAEIVQEYLDATAPGSYLALSHASLEGEADRAEEATEQFRNRVTDFSMRTRAEIADLLAGVEVVDPGVVYLTEWRPEPGDEDPDPKQMSTFAAVGRKAG